MNFYDFVGLAPSDPGGDGMSIFCIFDGKTVRIMKRFVSVFVVILSTAFVSYAQEISQETADRAVDTDTYVIDYANDKRPMFDGDMSYMKLNKWVDSHLRYPKHAKKEGIQGKVIIGFTITKEGKLTDVKVLRGIHPQLDEEAIRVIKTTARKWTCGYHSLNGDPCDVTFTYPVVFRL